MADQTLTRDELAQVLQRMADAGATPEQVRAQAEQLASRVSEITPVASHSTNPNLDWEQVNKQWDQMRRRANDPAVLASTGAALATGGASVPIQMLAQGGAGLVSGVGRTIAGGGSAKDAAWNAGTDIATNLLPMGVAKAVGAGWNVLAPKLESQGLKILKSVYKVRDPVAKLAAASQGGTNPDAGVDQIIRNIAEANLGKPSQANRRAVYAMKEAAGQEVEKQALIPPDRPVGITRADRLLPSHATSVEDVPLGGEWSSTHGTRTAAAIPGTKYQEAPFPVVRPVSAARGGFAGDQIPSTQYLGHAVSDERPYVPQLNTGAREIGPPGTGDTLSGPGVWRRVVEPQVKGGQPFDTVARKDIVNSIKQDIADAKFSASPTTGLEALLARWEQMPEFIPRGQVREATKGINTRLAPRFHNAINDPVAVAAEKDVARELNAQMRTPAMEAANKRYGELKPMALAISHAAKRAGARDIISPMDAVKILTGSEIGSIGGLPGRVIGTGLGVGAAVASHPRPQGWMGQKLFNAGQMQLPSSSLMRFAAPTAEMIRAAIIQMLNQQQP